MDVRKCYLNEGDIVDSKYRIDKVLGEGSFGMVYRVVDYDGMQYALKLLRLWEVNTNVRDALMQRFEMEFETGQIPSHFLVHSLAHGIIEGNPYIIMEYCSRGDLLSIIQQKRPNLSQVAAHVLCGLRDLHDNGKVHRDLKPENVLLKDDDCFALTDFGITGDQKKRMTVSDNSQIFGTYPYIPPEQFNARRETTVLPTSDIFSFGVMMYQLLTGELPFGPLDDASQLAVYLNRSRNGDWDKDYLNYIDDGSRWIELIGGCLNPHVDERLQNVDQVLSLLPDGKRWIKDWHTSHTRDYQTRIVHGVLLRVMQGEDYGMVYKLDDMLLGGKSILTIGRMDDLTKNDISIRDFDSGFVSRRHCTLELDYESGHWIIRDGQWDFDNTGGWKRSTNGTFVNSKEVSPDGLSFIPGDIISIGDVKLRVEGY